MHRHEVAVNLRSIAGDLHGGVPRYVSEVVGHLPDLRPIRPPEGWASGVRGHAWEQLALSRQLGSDQLLWSPANFGPVIRRRQVLSVYDTSPIDRPDGFGRRYSEAFRRLVGGAARRSEHILTISDFSKERIVEVFRRSPSDITVAEPGVSTTFRPDPSVERGASDVVVAGPDPRKNLERVAAAFAAVAEHDDSRRLVVVTGRRPDGVFATSPSLAHPQIDVVTDPSDGELARLYQAARTVVSVPLYEGYGLPAAEALACGAPLIVSDIPAHRHALPHAAAVVDPLDTDAIAQAMREDLAPTDSWVRRDWTETVSIIGATLDRFA